MREIKFRAWNGKEMHLPESSDVNDFFIDPEGRILYNREIGVEGHTCVYKRQNWILMQYTGLKDKNSKEIYEGDIVLTQPYSDKPYSEKRRLKRHTGFVEYKTEGDYSAEWTVHIKDEGEYGCHNFGPFFGCEVIGNIYEHPELLQNETEPLPSGS